MTVSSKPSNKKLQGSLGLPGHTLLALFALIAGATQVTAVHRLGSSHTAGEDHVRSLESTCDPSNVAKIRIESTTGKVINMFELRAYNDNGVNVAKGKSATQSSLHNNDNRFRASMAVDGSKSTFSRTADADNEAYWQVDLGSSGDIDTIVIFNKGCASSLECSCRLSYATISLLDDEGNEVSFRSIGNTCGVKSITRSFECPVPPYTLPDLKYPFDALEPYIDKSTMEIHHDKHHATYVDNINKFFNGKPKVDILGLQLKALEAGPAVRNNGGGHYNHAFFWDELAPYEQAKQTKPSAELLAMINQSFGSMEEMKVAFEACAAPGELFGSGWVWVCVDQDADELKLVGTPNQDNPLMEGVLPEGVIFPILGLDVWEHAYYLKYQNRRTEYVANWWNIVNWDKVSENFAYAVENKSGVPVRG